MYSTVSFLCSFEKPVGQIMTGVQKIIFRSLMTALLSFSGTRDAAEETDPTSKLLV